ncbi:tRNA(fMet)-specific endonuclease VapC [Lachnospiraceae bacterium]|nr:tRNA(fMet)-specific endonuclease VapC [Lachnospiraceae bacterium]
MRKLKVYLDTSVVSYLYQLDTPEKMKDTLELWELFGQGRYEVYISDIVLNEISGCSQEKLDILLGYLKQVQYHLIHTDEDTVELAEKFIDFGILKKKSFDDCQHIAAAILAGCDIITSWNFKHIVNVKTVRGVKTITTLEGYKDLLIYSPSVLLEGDDEDDDETDSQ